MKNSFVLLMAGRGERAGLNPSKVLYPINTIPLFYYSLKTAMMVGFDEYLLVTSGEETVEEFIRLIIRNLELPTNLKFIIGGKTRSESVKNAIKEVTGDLVFIHDAARPLVTIDDFNNLKEASTKYLCGTLYHHVVDTLKQIKPSVQTIDRKNIYAVSTPQFFHHSLFKDILNNEREITDELSLFEDKIEIGFVEETTNNIKLTTRADLDYIKCMIETKTINYIGHSLDYHPFSSEGTLILGGIQFPNYPILEGHSDADVAYHAVTEAIMGAAKLGDLGTLFPDTDPKYKGIASSELLKEVVRRVKEENYRIINIDLTLYLIKPSLKDTKQQMAINISELTGCTHVNVKAATLNKRGLISLEEGIGAEAVVILNK